MTRSQLGRRLCLLLVTGGLFAANAPELNAPPPSAPKPDAGQETPGEAEQSDGAAAPDYRTGANPVAHRIERVTAYSDRARVQRGATVDLKPGPQWVKFGSLPGKLAKDSVIVTPPKGFQGRIAQVVLEEAFEHAVLPSDVRAKLSELRGAYGKLLAERQEESAARAALEMVLALKYEAPFRRDDSHQTYRGFSARPDRLVASLDAVEKESVELSSKVQAAEARVHETTERVSFLEQELERVTSTSDQLWMVEVYVLVDSAIRQKATLQLSYFASAASWHPLYDVRAELDRSSGTCDLKLVTSALVEQHTGEAWKGVELTLSTLDPVPLFLPRLTRWILEERRHEAPRSYDYAAGNKVGGGARAGALRKGLAPPGNAARADRDGSKDSPREEESAQLQEAGAAASDELAAAPVVQQAQANLVAANEPAAAPARQEMAKSSGSAIANSKKKPTYLAAGSDLYPLRPYEELFPRLQSIERQLDQWQGSETARANTYQPAPAGSAPRATRYDDQSLPAVQAHGRVLEYTSPFAIDLASDDPALKTPVTSQHLKGELSYFAVPKKDPRVFVRAKAVNDSAHPLLGGQAQIFMDGDLITRTELTGVPEGGKFTVDLGVDKNLETKRTVRKTSESKGLVSSRHVSHVEVEIEIANHNPFPVKLEIRDNYPLPPDSKVEIALQQTSPEATEKKDGLLRWDLPLAAREKRTLTFRYQVSHPESLLVSEFD